MQLKAALTASVLGLALTACDREPGSASGSAAEGQPRSVHALLLAIDDALQHGSTDALAALRLDAARIRTLCPGLGPEQLEPLEQSWQEDHPSTCVALTDWSKLERRVPQLPQLPGMRGLNVGTKVCDETWEGCAAISRMCKSEIFYVMPATPDAGFKVNVSGVVRVGEEYWLIRAPRCMAKGSNARP